MTHYYDICILCEDGTKMLREDGSDLLREEAISPFQPIAPTTSNWQDAPTPPSANWTRI